MLSIDTMMPAGGLDLYSTARDPRARSHSMYSSTSASTQLRLADIAKQYGMGMHVENWREDQQPVRQYLPLQHIIGSLKRDRDEPVTYIEPPKSKTVRRSKTIDTPRTEDSFLDLLRTPKRRKTSLGSFAASETSANSDPDRRFAWQAAEHVAKEIPTSALPGLNHILNLSTITAEERDIFSEYAPKHLEDSQILMNEVLSLREQMTHEGDEEVLEDDDGAKTPVVPPERDAEVRKALEDWIDFNPSKRYIAKI